MTDEQANLSIVICTRNRAEDLILALDSIAAQKVRPKEVLIVDSSDDDRVKEAVSRWRKEKGFEGLDYLSSAPGLTHQRNVGADRATGEFISYLDDDVELDPGYYKAVLAAFDDPSIHGAMGYDLEASLGGPGGRLFRRLFLLPRMDGFGKIQASGFPSWNTFPKTKSPVGILRGHNMTYRRKILEEFRFNEDFDGYGLMEDVEFSCRVGSRYPMLMLPEAKLRHKKSPTARESYRKLFRMRTINQWRIHRRCVRRGIGTRLCYEWSNLGVLIWSLMKDLRGGAEAFQGYREGRREIRRLPRKESA